MLRTTIPAIALSLGLVLTGCNDQADETSHAPDAAVTQSAAAQQAMEKAGEAVTDALVEQNSNVDLKAVAGRVDGSTSGLATMWPFAMGERVQLLTAEGFEFSSSVEFDVDLDVAGPDGSSDRYPHATGIIHVVGTATGDTDDCIASGEVAYTVDLTVTSDVVVTDPHDGSQVTWPTGGSASWGVDLAWAVTDVNNWSYQADVTKDVEDRTVIVTTATGDDFSAVVDIHHQARRTVAATAGILSTSFSLKGLRHAVWTGPSGKTWDVTWDVQSLFEIHLTVNGTHYGPYTLGEIIRRYRIGLHTEAG